MSLQSLTTQRLPDESLHKPIIHGGDLMLSDASSPNHAMQVIDLDMLDKVGSAKGVEEMRVQLKQQVWLTCFLY